MNFIQKHWNGEFSLGISYWIFGSLFGIGFSFALLVLFEFLVVPFFNRPTIGLVLILLALLVITLVFVVWQLVGIWKSANRHRLETGRSFWATVAQIMVIFGFLSLLGYTINSIKVIDLVMSAANESEFQSASVVLEGDSSSNYIVVDGNLTFTVADAIKNYLIYNSNIEVIVINSNGGYIGVGQEIGDLVRLYELTVVVDGNCLSACTMVLSSSPYPTIIPGSIVGFHSPIDIGVEEVDRAGQTLMLDYFRSNGIDERVIEYTRITDGDDMWIPTTAELINYGVIKFVYDLKMDTYRHANEWCNSNLIICNQAH